MILAAVNLVALLPCLCVICVLLIAGVTALSILLARANKINREKMQKDVYVREIVVLNADNKNLAKNLTANSGRESNGKEGNLCL